MGIVRGVQEESFLVYDNGRTRKDAEILSLADVPDSCVVSSMLTRYFVIRKGLKSRDFGGNPIVFSYKGNESKIGKVNFYNEHSALIEEITKKMGECYRKNKKYLTTSEIGGVMLYLRLDKKYPKEIVDNFFEQLADYRLCTVEPINKLRDKLLSYADSKGQTLKATYRMAFIIKTWNCYIRQKDMKVLTYNPNKEKDLWFV